MSFFDKIRNWLSSAPEESFLEQLMGDMGRELDKRYEQLEPFSPSDKELLHGKLDEIINYANSKILMARKIRDLSNKTTRDID